ncbi:MAG: DNA gyrase inhibitor YacG [Methyloligella sp. ZOD6]
MTGSKRPQREKRAGAEPKCPICGKPTVDVYRPFCSKRCADVDLNRWLSGQYAVPGEPAGQGASDEDGED